MHYKKKAKLTAKTRCIGLRVPLEVFDALDELSNDQGWSKSYIMYKIIEDHLKQEGYLK